MRRRQCDDRQYDPSRGRHADRFTTTLADADGLSGPISYQWYLDGVAIGGATGATYTAVPADVGGVITVVASYTDDQGTFESVSSGATAAVTNVNYAPTGSVTISGTPTEDQTLTASNTLADADGMGPVSYQWQRDGVDIGGATGSTYILGDADVGTTITVVAGYTDGDGTNESVSSAGVGPIANVNDAPVIGGTDTRWLSIEEDIRTPTDCSTRAVLWLSRDPDAGESSFQAETVVGSLWDVSPSMRRAAGTTPRTTPKRRSSSLMWARVSPMC